MRSSYSKEDVILLLKDITGLVRAAANRREGTTDTGRPSLL